MNDPRRKSKPARMRRGISQWINDLQLQHYLALPSNMRAGTIAALKAYNARFSGDARVLESEERTYDGLRKAGMPEE